MTDVKQDPVSTVPKDMLTYQHPRTLDEAFNDRGPVIDPEDLPMGWLDKLVLWVAPVAVLFVVVLFSLGVI